MAGPDPVEYQIRRFLIQRGISQIQLADMAGLSPSTIERLLKGSYSPKTVRIIEDRLRIDLSGGASRPVTVSSKRFGGYTRENYAMYQGEYTAYRRSYSYPDNIVASGFRFQWSYDERCMQFFEYGEYPPDRGTDQAHTNMGNIHISDFVDLLHLVTLYEGAVRTITLTKMRPRLRNRLHGIILSQADPNLSFRPAVSPIVLVKLPEDDAGGKIQSRIGQIAPGDDAYGEINEWLNETEEEIALFPSIKTRRNESAD